MTRHALVLVLAGLSAARVRAAPEVPFRNVSHGAVLTAGIATMPVGDAIVGELGVTTRGLRSAEATAWLYQWEGFGAARGGMLANSRPYGFYLGGRLRGMGELGRRVAPASAWSGYVGARLGAGLDILTRPGVEFSKLNTINSTDGFAGVVADGLVRVSVGASWLAVTHSLLLTAFFQLQLRLPRLNTPGAGFSGGGLALRYDLPQSFTLGLDLFVGVAGAVEDKVLRSVDQETRLEGTLGLRKTFGNGMWLGLDLKLARNSHRVEYVATHTVYDSFNPKDFAATLSFGVPFGRQE